MSETGDKDGQSAQQLDQENNTNPVPLGILEAEILKHLWDAGVPQTSVQVLDAFYVSRQQELQNMHSPSMVAVTLSRMVDKGLLTMARQPSRSGMGGGTGKGYYAPNVSRAEITLAALDLASHTLFGQSFDWLLLRLCDTGGKPTENNRASPEGHNAFIVSLKELLTAQQAPTVRVSGDKPKGSANRKKQAGGKAEE